MFMNEYLLHVKAKLLMDLGCVYGFSCTLHADWNERCL